MFWFLFAGLIRNEVAEMSPLEMIGTNKNPSLVVAIPLYNSEQYIAKTIHSVLTQSYQNFELIIIDNCSTDNSAKIVNSFDDSRVMYMKNKTNLGMYGNFNRCLKETQGYDYVLMLCSDDTIVPDYIQSKIYMFESHPELVMVCNSTQVLTAEGRNLFIRRNMPSGIWDGKEILRRSRIYGNIFGEPSCVMFRGSILNSIGYFDVKFSYATDWEYYVRVASLGYVGFIDRPLSTFRISTTSGTSKLLHYPKLIKKEHDLISKKISNLLNEPENSLSVFKRNLIFYFRFFLKLIVFRVYKIFRIMK